MTRNICCPPVSPRPPEMPDPCPPSPIRFRRKPLTMGGFNYVWEDTSDYSLDTGRTTRALSTAKQIDVPKRGLIIYQPITIHVINSGGSGALGYDFGFKIGATEYWTSDEYQDANFLYRGTGYTGGQTNHVTLTNAPWNFSKRAFSFFIGSDFPTCLIDIEQSGLASGRQSVQPIARRGLYTSGSASGTLKGSVTPTRVGISFVEW